MKISKAIFKKLKEHKRNARYANGLVKGEEANGKISKEDIENSRINARKMLEKFSKI